MKVLYVITQSSWGGAQKYVYSLASGLSGKNDLEILVAGGKESRGEMVERLEAIGIKFIALNHMVHNINPVEDMLAVFELKKIIEKENPNVINLNSSKAGVVGSIAAKLARHKAKVIYTVHGWVFNENINPAIKLTYYLIEKLTARFKDAFICLSEYERNISIVKRIALAKKLILIRNGIDLPDDYFLPPEAAKQKLKISEKKNIAIGCIANFYPTKGLKYLIDAIKILAKDLQLPIKAIIIGDGGLRTQLEQQIKDLKLENKIILAGAIPDAGKYLKAFDIAVMSSVKEGAPFFLLEAMSAGLPIVATKVGGIPEIIEDGVTGLLTTAKDVKDLVAKLKQLIADQNLRQTMGQAGLARIKNEFNEAKMIEQTLKVYLK